MASSVENRKLAFPSECFSYSGECRAPMGLNIAYPLALKEQEFEFYLPRCHCRFDALRWNGAGARDPSDDLKKSEVIAWVGIGPL